MAMFFGFWLGLLVSCEMSDNLHAECDLWTPSHCRYSRKKKNKTLRNFFFRIPSAPRLPQTSTIKTKEHYIYNLFTLTLSHRSHYK